MQHRKLTEWSMLLTSLTQLGIAKYDGVRATMINRDAQIILQSMSSPLLRKECR
jgi:hypothetical protein